MPVKYPITFLEEIDTLIHLKTIGILLAYLDMEIKRIRLAKIILEKNKIERFTLPYFKTYYKTTVLNVVWN